MRTILCRRGKGEEALAWMRELMGKLKLTVNEEKTRSCKVPEEFNFLGYSVLQRHLERRATQERTRCREAA
jgi:RNA-directed DNA polymerase